MMVFLVEGAIPDVWLPDPSCARPGVETEVEAVVISVGDPSELVVVMTFVIVEETTGGVVLVEVALSLELVALSDVLVDLLVCSVDLEVVGGGVVEEDGGGVVVTSVLDVGVDSAEVWIVEDLEAEGDVVVLVGPTELESSSASPDLCLLTTWWLST